MKLTAEVHVLVIIAFATILMWIPYTLARIVTRGLIPAMSNPDSSYPADPVWAQRARMAHANAVENLVVFAPLVIIAALVRVSTPATIFAAKLYLAARIVHYVVYAAGIPFVRTLSFIVGFGATVAFAVALLGLPA